MEHINVKKLTEELYKLTPKKGYILVNKVTKLKYSEAITKNPEKFIAIKK